MKLSLLAEMTDLMSRVGRANPDLVQDRNVALFIQACIEEAKVPPIRNREKNFHPENSA